MNERTIHKTGERDLLNFPNLHCTVLSASKSMKKILIKLFLTQIKGMENNKNMNGTDYKGCNDNCRRM